MDNFLKHKQDFLKKIDKSKKHSIDKEIKKLIKKINSLDEYYTTSSCSGRIVLLEKKSEKKQDVNWLFKSHNKISLNDVLKALKILPDNDIWFRYEAAIFHIACRNIENAQKLINIARSVGFKRSGIQSTRKKVTVEIISSDCIDTIIARKGKLLVDRLYLKTLANEANKKMRKNRYKIRKLESSLLSSFSA